MLLTALSDTSKNYYIAMVAYDSTGNVSAISNVVTTKGTGSEIKNSGALDFAFDGLYPNPFNPVTEIRYTLPVSERKSPVVLRIFNINGDLIRTIEKKYIKAGRYSAIWNGQDAKGLRCASGMYIYQFSWEKNIIKGKAVFLK